MYWGNEKREKLTISFLLIALSVASLLIGRTLANTLIVTTYPTTILPYFYLAQAALLIVTTILTIKYQNKELKKFSIVFKTMVIGALVIFTIALKSELPFAPFIIAVLIVIFVSNISTIPWNYATKIFNVQEYKQYRKLLQISGTLSAIVAGAAASFISAKFDLVALLIVIALIEGLSIFCIIPLSKYVPVEEITENQANFTHSLRNSVMFKHLAWFSIISMIVTTLIDYDFKLSLTNEIDKERINDVVTMILVISTACTLVVQVYFQDVFLRTLGSKRLIIVFPLMVLIVAAASFYFPTFTYIALLVIISDTFSFSTFSLSKSLYLNTLPSCIRNLGLINLSGIVKPIAITLSSLLVFFLTPVKSPRLSIALIVVGCLILLWQTIPLIKEYTSQLIQSVYLRRFKSELIGALERDPDELIGAVNQSLTYNDPEVQLFGLQLLISHKDLALPTPVKTLLHSENINVLKETTKLLSNHPTQREFVSDGMEIFTKTDDPEVQWYLALYLAQEKLPALLPLADDLVKNKTSARKAISCFIYLKQGDLEQQITAMKTLNKLLHSNNEEEQKWFLKILNEMPQVNKDDYLIQFINENNPVIQNLALKQVSNNPGEELIKILIEHLGNRAIAYSLNKSFIRLGEQTISLLEQQFKDSSKYPVKIACIQILTKIPGKKTETSIIDILKNTNDVVIKTTLAKYLAHRSIKNGISQTLADFLSEQIIAEVNSYAQLAHQALQYTNPIIKAEINSRIEFIIKRVLYYLCAITCSTDILNTIPLLTSTASDRNEQAMGIELVDTEIEDRQLASQLMMLLLRKTPKAITSESLAITDPWLQDFINKVETNNMESIYKLIRLRTIDLFKNFSAETLEVLAECCASRDMAKGEIIFKEGDHGNGLYIIDSGEVIVRKQDKVLANLTAGAYFGELALLADIPRFATVTAVSEGALFFIDKQDFDRLTDELPEIMKNINKQVIGYLTVLATEDNEQRKLT